MEAHTVSAHGPRPDSRHLSFKWQDVRAYLLHPCLLPLRLDIMKSGDDDAAAAAAAAAATLLALFDENLNESQLSNLGTAFLSGTRFFTLPKFVYIVKTKNPH